MRPRLALVAGAAFLLGTLAAPWMPWSTERQTLALTGIGNDQARVRSASADGWVVQRTDRLDGVGHLVTVERPRALGLWLAAGDLYNDLTRR